MDIEIAAPPATIAGVMFDPARDPEWIANVTRVDILDPALAVGARVQRQGHVNGTDVSWVSEVMVAHFPHLLRLRIADGPLAGTLQYEIQRSGSGSHVRLRHVNAAGSPAGDLLGADLVRLKALIEG